jgi:biopolymer transport protein ExbD
VIRFECDQCGKHVRASEKHVGRRAECPRCGAKLVVPEPMRDVPVVAEREVDFVEALTGYAPPADYEADTEDTQPLMRPGPKADYEDLVDMTAMVDIVFFLLIFFLVTSMQSLDASIPMPVPQNETGAPTAAAAPTPEAEDTIVVNIDEEDRVWIDDQEMANEHDVVNKLVELRSGPGNPDKLMIVGNGNATHGTAVMVHDSANEAGMASIKLAIQERAE